MLAVLLIGCAEPEGGAVLTEGTGAEVADAWAYTHHEDMIRLFYGTISGTVTTARYDDEVAYATDRPHHWSAFVLQWHSDPDAGLSIERARLVYTAWADTFHARPAQLMRAQARVGDVYESDVMRSTLVDHGPCTELLDLDGWRMGDLGAAEPLDASLLEGVDCLHLSLEKTGEDHPALGEWWLTREYGLVQFRLIFEDFQDDNEDGLWQLGTF